MGSLKNHILCCTAKKIKLTLVQRNQVSPDIEFLLKSEMLKSSNTVHYITGPSQGLKFWGASSTGWG